MTSQLAVTRSVVIAASPDRVWRAVTDPSEIRKWFIEFDFTKFEVGASFTCTADDQSGPGVITAIEPPHRFAYQWTPESGHSEYTLVTWLIESVEGGTRVTVTEAGFEVLPGDLGATVHERNGRGWAECMVNLKHYIEGGKDANGIE